MNWSTAILMHSFLSCLSCHPGQEEEQARKKSQEGSGLTVNTDTALFFKTGVQAAWMNRMSVVVSKPRFFVGGL